MPLARLSVPSLLPNEKVRALADAVHQGLVATCNVPPNDRFQLITTFPEERMIIDPTFPDVRRTAEASIVEILFLEGRTVQQKARLFWHIAQGAMNAGFAGDDIMVALSENAPTDWSLGSGRAYAQDHRPSDCPGEGCDGSDEAARALSDEGNPFSDRRSLQARARNQGLACRLNHITPKPDGCDEG